MGYRWGLPGPALVRPTPILFQNLSTFSAKVPHDQAPFRGRSLSETQSGAKDGQV